jgi:hypothetical protein
MPDAVIWDIGEGGKKRHKQHYQEGRTTASYDEGMVCATAVASCSKHQAWPPTYHFERLLEETCPNHAYLIKHKLRGYNMTKNIMSSGSLARGMEVDDVPDEGGMTHLPKEHMVLMIYDGRPSPAMCHMSSPRLGTLAPCG